MSKSPSLWHRLQLRWRRARLAKPTGEVSRRRFIAQGGALLVSGVLLFTRRLRASAWALETKRAPVRPPTASADDSAFRAACIGCGLCGSVCENGCIRYFGADEPTWGPLTPYLDVRRRSCTLCMRCTNICPTGALQGVPKEMERISAEIKMGVAVVDPNRCISYVGRACGYCHDACPLPKKAIRLVRGAKPLVIEDGCVGCGRCVELCPQVPTAIDVFRETLG